MAAAKSEVLGPTFLDGSPPLLVPLDRRPGSRETRHCDRLAPRRLPSLLALAIPAAGGRPKITEEIRVLIQRLAQENQGWGAPKIHGELQKLGLVVSERSVARYLRRIRRRGDPAKSWLTFLQNHREVIAAFDFFMEPTVSVLSAGLRKRGSSGERSGLGWVNHGNDDFFGSFVIRWRFQKGDDAGVGNKSMSEHLQHLRRFQSRTNRLDRTDRALPTDQPSVPTLMRQFSWS